MEQVGQGDREHGSRGPSFLHPLVSPEPLLSGMARRGVLAHLPSGIVKMNKEPIIPKFGEHLIMMTIHISCKRGDTSWGQKARAQTHCLPLLPLTL